MVLAIIFVVIIVIVYVLSHVDSSSGGDNHTRVSKSSNSTTNYFKEYPSSEVSLAVVHVLETTQIMANSKNIDTIIGRADFLEKRMVVLKANRLTDKYSTDVQAGLDRYKSTYYNRDIHKWQASIIFNPGSFDFDFFYVRSLYDGFMAHYDHQEKEIANLKRESAIKNRYKKLNELFGEFINEFDKVWDTADANKFKIDHMNELKTMRKAIKSKMK